MSLILAVEPDRRQAKQLSSLVRQHIRAELVIADSGAAALESLAGRVPDLILTPALLPPKDEAVLTGWLRDLGDAASHVQTLAIPILADGEKRQKEQASSIFGRLRDSHAGTATGCEPSVFADQVRVYLERAASERSAPVAEPPVSEATMSAAEPETVDAGEFEDVTFDDLVFEPSPAVEPEPPAPAPAEPAAVRSPTPFARPEKRVDPATLRSWEAELGLESAPSTAPPLWRERSEETRDVPSLVVAPAREPGAKRGFDPADPLYAPLFQRLDELAAAAV